MFTKFIPFCERITDGARNGSNIILSVGSLSPVDQRFIKEIVRRGFAAGLVVLSCDTNDAPVEDAISFDHYTRAFPLLVHDLFEQEDAAVSHTGIKDRFKTKGRHARSFGHQDRSASSQGLRNKYRPTIIPKKKT